MITLVVFTAWGIVAALTHYVAVPLLARRGEKLNLEAEVVALIALAFGLLISFNAVTVWQTVDVARDAVIREVASLEAANYEIDVLPSPQREQGRAALTAYVDYVLGKEWPLLSNGRAHTDRPAPLLALLDFDRQIARDDLHDALRNAVAARIDRIRLSLYRMSRARWAVVVLLGILLIQAMGLLHAEHRRGRAFALGFVAVTIAICFVILFAHGRPFIGEHAIQPTDLQQLKLRLAARG